jgi:hypothetical protein
MQDILLHKNKVADVNDQTVQHDSAQQWVVQI